MFQLKNEKVEVVAKDKNNPEAVLTANLIMEEFNLKNTGMRVYKSEMRVRELTEEMNKLYDSIEEVDANPDSKFALRKLKALIRKESRFAAFKRNYIREICQKYTSLLNS